MYRPPPWRADAKLEVFDVTLHVRKHKVSTVLTSTPAVSMI